MANKKTPTTPAIHVLNEAGVAYNVHAYDFAPDEGAIGMQAAEALGVAPKRILKTLVIDVEGAGLALALVPVDEELDLKAAARALGAKRATMASIAEAQRATGYVKGGISPLGQRRRLPAVIDEGVTECQEFILVNAGRRGLQVELCVGDLVELLHLKIAKISNH